MGFRFRKSLKLGKGVRLNLGKRGVTSTSIGGKGVTLNLGKSGSKTTLNIPGTGVSYTSSTPKEQRVIDPTPYEQNSGCLSILNLILSVVQVLISGVGLLFWSLVTIALCYLVILFVFS